MNKLIKPRKTTSGDALRSRTMVYALSNPSSSTDLTTTTKISRPALDQRVTDPTVTTSLSPYIPSFPASYSPRSRTETYWAARAMTAETLLSARTEHLVEVKNLTYAGDVRREKEIADLTQAHNERLARLEKLIIILLGFIALFFGALFMAYVDASSSSLHASSNHRSWAHFTIPVLSPFASVVEQEVSVIGTRTITAGILMFACLGYLMFRYWATKSQLR